MMSLVQIEYFMAFYLASVLDGNLFVNLMLVGAGETVAGIWSGILLSRMKDTHVFILSALLNGISYVLFFFVPSGIAQYMCLFLTVSGIAGKFNTIYVLSELRIPPENIGSALVIIITVAIMAAGLSPYFA